MHRVPSCAKMPITAMSLGRKRPSEPRVSAARGWLTCAAVMSIATACGGAGASGAPRREPETAHGAGSRGAAPAPEPTASARAPADATCDLMPLTEVLGCGALEGATPAGGWDAEVTDAVAAARGGADARRRAPPAGVTSAERPLEPAEERAVRAGRHVLCAAPRPWPDEAVPYAIARVFYDAHHFREAAPLFDAVLRDAPRHELAEYAANLALDSANVRGTQVREAGGGEGACLDTLGAWTRDYAALFACGSAGAPSELCETLERIRCELVRKDADASARDGDPAAASAAYESVYTTRCRDRVDEALYNAAVLAERARDPARARRLREQLRAAYPQSPLVARP